jgi:hypothetical protein
VSQTIRLPQGLDATAVLDIDVRLRNTSTGTVSFMVLDKAPVVIRVYDGVSARTAMLYDQGNVGTVRLPRSITLAPNGEELLSNGISLAELRANGVRSGRVLIVALVTASSDIGGQFEVPIGEVILP